MNLLILGLAAALFMPQPAPQAAGPQVSLCFDTEYVGKFRSWDNYQYTGRVRVDGDAETHGYGVIAEDRHGNLWAQGGAAVRARNGRTDAPTEFGVHNGSSYPLHFRLVRLDDARTYTWFRRRSMELRQLDDEDMAEVTQLGGPNACVFDLDDDGKPFSRNCECSAPR